MPILFDSHFIVEHFPAICFARLTIKCVNDTNSEQSEKKKKTRGRAIIKCARFMAQAAQNESKTQRKSRKKMDVEEAETNTVCIYRYMQKA